MKRVYQLFLTKIFYLCFFSSILWMGCDDPSSSSDPSSSNSECQENSLNCECGEETSCQAPFVCLQEVCQSCMLGSQGCGCLEGNLCTPTGASPLMCLEGTCQPLECQIGTSGCACDQNQECQTGLTCDTNDICADPDCPEGQQGCVCREDRSCDSGLVCMDQHCDTPPNCTSGTEGCICDQDLGCQSGLQCTIDELCEPIPACTSGALGCECNSNGSCDASDAYCHEDGTCQRAQCPAGDEGCACGIQQQCNQNPNGEVLVCEAGVCQSPQCSSGSLGCVCLGGSECDGDAVCVSGYCMGSDCRAGEEFCACTAGGCGPGLRCEQNRICKDNTGYTQGGCLGSDRCYHGNQCLRNVCVSCSLGSQNCHCRDDSSCNIGLSCLQGVCVDPKGLAIEPPPINAICYTPCTQGITQNGEYFECSANGLMEGCLEGTTCIEGQCLRDTDLPSSCTSDIECPDFQTCLVGRCISNCTSSEECLEGAICYRTVCRRQCTVVGNECLNDQYCELVDSENGHCMTNVPASGNTQIELINRFSLNRDLVYFSNGNQQVDLQITNNEPFEVQFTFTKRLHRLFQEDQIDELNLSPQETCQPPNCPLWWITLSDGQESWETTRHTLTLGANETRPITFDMGNGISSDRWEGIVEITNNHGHIQSVMVNYSSSLTGRWNGNVYYFGNFKDIGVREWEAIKGSPEDDEAIDRMENAFLKVWANFRKGRINYSQFKAALTSTQTESWRSQRLKEMGCPDNAVCYPYSNADGFLEYTTDSINIPVPSGVVEMPLTVQVAKSNDETVCSTSHCWAGRIESTRALQYAGLPQVVIDFNTNPQLCDLQEEELGCMTFVNRFESEIKVGARYPTIKSNTTCSSSDFTQIETPWLLVGYKGRSEFDEERGKFYSYECVDSQLPQGKGNPISDGQSQHRFIELVDGALINNNTLFVIFRERMDSMISNQPEDEIQRYGYFLLRKSEETLRLADYQPNQSPNPQHEQRSSFEGCTNDFLSLFDLNQTHLAENPNIVVQSILQGVVNLESQEQVQAQNEGVHYFCEDTGLFDGGAGDTRTSQQMERVSCPYGSRVTFFTLNLNHQPQPILNQCGTLSLSDCHQNWIANLTCQQDGSCQDQLNTWMENHSYQIRMDPFYVCSNPNQVYCNENRQNLREGKIFYAESEEETPFKSIRIDVDQAFRYRTRFVNRSGTNLGFTPEICQPNTDLIPYCYDPQGIETLRERVNCGIEIYVNQEHYSQLSETLQRELKEYLIENFSFVEQRDDLNQTQVRRGFEYLDSELLIMLGDEAYTLALSSRFDLAETRIGSFEGELFEENGMSLSGLAGMEMRSLYTAVQYYQLVLDRFHNNSTQIAQSIQQEEEGSQESFITAETVASYFGRLLRASTQKSKVWAEIAQRYQNFNRPDLARKVIERAYTTTYVESMIFTQLLKEIVDITEPEKITQVRNQVDFAQRSYRVALSLMRESYEKLTDDLNYFGFAPDYIPFPALEELRDNSVEVGLLRAQARVNLALQAEQTALDSNRSFNTDQANFQNELARLENSYDSQLSELCGTFEVDGRIYPATIKYAYLLDATRELGDPCGLTGTGQIHNTFGQIDILYTELRRIRQSIYNTHLEATIENQRWSQSCQVANAFSEFYITRSGQINSIQNEIDNIQTAMGVVDRTLSEISTIAQLAKCSIIAGLAAGGDCPSAGIASAVYQGALVANLATRAGLDIAINQQQQAVRGFQSDIEIARNGMQCALVEIEGKARMQTILLRLSELSLEALKVEYEINQVLSSTRQLKNQATRLQQEASEMEELTINVEVARNDPNTRIYRNEAIINADRTFYSALREVYKTTRLLEYYTSQSYGAKEQLFLTRMVGRGDYNLQLYLIELEDAFREFEDYYGLPTQRLAILSLKDDIFAIPRIKLDGTEGVYSDADRIILFREYLNDPNLLDENGYITIPFSTKIDQLSPLTRNHKIKYIEVSILGSQQGDDLARVYLRMAGTASVIPLGGGLTEYYTFPKRLAVINPFFLGKSEYIDPLIYRNRRMFDRPFVNARWELVLNTYDEEVNFDLNLYNISDIKLYIYYNDFTEF